MALIAAGVVPVLGAAAHAAPVTTDNACTNALSATPSQIPMDLEGTAPASGSAGTPISITSLNVTGNIPAAFIQAGIGLGVLHDGQQVSGSISVTVHATNATVAETTLSGTANATIHAPAGVAQPLTVSVSLGSHSWTPVASGPMTLSEALTGTAGNGGNAGAITDGALLLSAVLPIGTVNIACKPGTVTAGVASFASSVDPFASVDVAAATTTTGGSTTTDSTTTTTDSTTTTTTGSTTTTTGSTTTTTASTSTTIAAATYLPAGSAATPYICKGADQATQDTLDIFAPPGTPPGGGAINFDIVLANDPVVPAPATDASFPIDFRWTVTLDSGLVSTLHGLGITSVSISGASYDALALSGATGPDVIGTPPARSVSVGTGPVTFGEGPFTGTFTRTAVDPQPIVFAAGKVLVSATPNGFPNPFNLDCNPPEGATTNRISLVNQVGSPPSTIATSTTGSVLGEVINSNSSLARTGAPQSTLIMVGLAMFLIDVGYLMVTAVHPISSGRSRREAGFTS
ncbi:MAG: hypothetical protein QOI95_3598 [Acidimicrobiaceae bacterium]